jgi:hypothetical protein
MSLQFLHEYEGASRRVTRIAKKARELPDMEISVPKTECMFLRQYQECRQQPMSTEEYAEQKFKHVCEWCGMDYPSKDALTTHVHVHCKVRKGTREEEYPVEKVIDVRGRPEERFYRSRELHVLRNKITVITNITSAAHYS